MVGGVQFQGSSCSSLVIGVSAMRARTSASHACGSMSLSFAVSMSEARIAQWSAPPSEPAKRLFLRVSARGRMERSTMLLSSSMRPSSRKRAHLKVCSLKGA